MQQVIQDLYIDVISTSQKKLDNYWGMNSQIEYMKFDRVQTTEMEVLAEKKKKEILAL